MNRMIFWLSLRTDNIYDLNHMQWIDPGSSNASYYWNSRDHRKTTIELTADIVFGSKKVKLIVTNSYNSTELYDSTSATTMFPSTPTGGAPIPTGGDISNNSRASNHCDGYNNFFFLLGQVIVMLE